MKMVPNRRKVSVRDKAAKAPVTYRSKLMPGHIHRIGSLSGALLTLIQEVIAFP